MNLQALTNQLCCLWTARLETLLNRPLDGSERNDLKMLMLCAAKNNMDEAAVSLLLQRSFLS